MILLYFCSYFLLCQVVLIFFVKQRFNEKSPNSK
nr:MAG TPA: hypothetical protein [Bacteriophage sp.]DAV78837.1 MAG TPA: hypothetical protein [Caudoviricetes sp.]